MERYFIQHSISGSFVQGLFKMDVEGKLYFHSSFRKWEPALHRRTWTNPLYDLEEVGKETVDFYIEQRKDKYGS